MGTAAYSSITLVGGNTLEYVIEHPDEFILGSSSDKGQKRCSWYNLNEFSSEPQYLSLIHI